LTWQFQDETLLGEDHINKLLATAKSSGVDPDIVHWTGAARLGEQTEAVSIKP